jgi:hypothetical protein
MTVRKPIAGAGTHPAAVLLQLSAEDPAPRAHATGMIGSPQQGHVHGILDRGPDDHDCSSLLFTVDYLLQQHPRKHTLLATFLA